MRINRVRRARGPARLSPAQTMELVIGRGAEPSVFASADARAEAWRTHREWLMASVPPCQRASAYYTIELGIDDPGDPGAQLRVLLSRNLVSEQEAAVMEKDYALLAGIATGRLAANNKTVLRGFICYPPRAVRIGY